MDAHSKENFRLETLQKLLELNVEYNGTAVDPYGQTKAGFEISGEINRKIST